MSGIPPIDPSHSGSARSWTCSDMPERASPLASRTDRFARGTISSVSVPSERVESSKPLDAIGLTFSDAPQVASAATRAIADGIGAVLGDEAAAAEAVLEDANNDIEIEGAEAVATLDIKKKGVMETPTYLHLIGGGGVARKLDKKISKEIEDQFRFLVKIFGKALNCADKTTGDEIKVGVNRGTITLIKGDKLSGYPEELVVDLHDASQVKKVLQEQGYSPEEVDTFLPKIDESLKALKKKVLEHIGSTVADIPHYERGIRGVINKEHRFQRPAGYFVPDELKDTKRWGSTKKGLLSSMQEIFGTSPASLPRSKRTEINTAIKKAHTFKKKMLEKIKARQQEVQRAILLAKNPAEIDKCKGALSELAAFEQRIEAIDLFATSAAIYVAILVKAAEDEVLSSHASPHEDITDPAVREALLAKPGVKGQLQQKEKAVLSSALEQLKGYFSQKHNTFLFRRLSFDEKMIPKSEIHRYAVDALSLYFAQIEGCPREQCAHFRRSNKEDSAMGATLEDQLIVDSLKASGFSLADYMKHFPGRILLSGDNEAAISDKFDELYQ